MSFYGEASWKQATQRKDPTIKVRFPCQHNQWFRHPLDVNQPKWKWCEGGTTRRLRQPSWPYDRDLTHQTPGNIWIEIPT